MQRASRPSQLYDVIDQPGVSLGLHPADFPDARTNQSQQDEWNRTDRADRDREPPFQQKGGHTGGEELDCHCRDGGQADGAGDLYLGRINGEERDNIPVPCPHEARERQSDRVLVQVAADLESKPFAEIADQYMLQGGYEGAEHKSAEHEEDREKYSARL